MLMRYSYTSAWSIVGGVMLPNGATETEIIASDRSRCVLSQNPDGLLEKLDQGLAVGNICLAGLQGATSYSEGLQVAIDKIRNIRKESSQGHTIAVLQIYGETEFNISGTMGERETFNLALDAVDLATLKQDCRGEIEAMKLAICLETTPPSRLGALSEGFYFTDSKGKLHYSLTFGIQMEGSSSVTLSAEGPKSIALRYASLSENPGMASAQRLASQMFDFELDKLKSFLAGWSAFEILIRKSFKSLPRQSNSMAISSDATAWAEIKNDVTDPSSLTGNFVSVAGVLFSRVAAVEARSDYDTFCQLRDLRNSIYHGNEFSERDLPINELASILQKYLLARLAA